MFKRANKPLPLKNLNTDQDNKNTNNIFSAVQSNDLEKIRYFIDQEVDVNAHDRFGRAPLHYVTSKEALDLLVKKQADVHIKSLNMTNISKFDPYTPLSSACSYLKYLLVDPILQYYSLSDFENKPNYINKEKLLSLMWDSIYQGKKDLQELSLLRPLQQLEHQARVSQASELVTNEIKTEDLFSAIYANDLEKFKQLILQVPNINVRQGKDTLLSFAMSRHGYPFLTPIFLHSSSDLNKEPPDYIKKNQLAVSLWQACRQNKLSSQLITRSVIPPQTSQFYQKKNQIADDLWEKNKLKYQSEKDSTKMDMLIQGFHP